jgi:pyruvate,water dikinase
MSSSSDKSQALILPFKDIAIEDVPFVGGKNASLGEMYAKLTSEGVRVPNGFAVTANAYWLFLKETGLDKKIKQAIKGLDVSDVRMLARVGKTVRTLILKQRLPKEVEKAVGQAYAALAKEYKEPRLSVAVRSSATAEDLPGASFAGQQETYLNIRGEKDLLLAVKKCVASLFTDRALSYREAQGFDHLQVALSVGVQKMVRSDIGASGVMFTIDTESGFPGVVLINASYGLGEYVVKGRVTPDQYYVFKEGVLQGKSAIISRSLGTKDAKLIYAKGGSGTKQATTTKAERNSFVLKDADVIALAKWGMQIEKHYGRAQDIEWAKDGDSGQLFIVQARPETVKAKTDTLVLESYELKQKGTIILRGVSVGQKIGAGHVRLIEHPSQMKTFKKGEILVTRITDPDWEPIMRIASAIITEEGGKTSHAAIVSRELGVPAIVGARGARKALKTGRPITVSCAEGDEGIIYAGILPFEVKKTDVKPGVDTKTKIMMNVGDPDNAFNLRRLPSDGVGLAREEFIFTNFIRIHPLALVHYDKLADKEAKKQIAEITRGYKKKTDYCVERLAEGIGRIAAAFYPNDVIIRFSDFKTNEYATLLGGKEFEPKEENPMIGWRGASRYYSPEYKPGFALECEAIKKVRNDWGLTNVITMVPFCRTPEEGEKVIQTMEEFGLKRGENGLQVYVMCEIPSNVILAEDFARIFDGFSIGSNDLTQLTLGVDRDSALVSHVYNERNNAVKTLIRDVIRVAKKHKKKIGICGQAPSDYPEFAEFLVREGIDSISLNPDTIVKTRERIAYVEKTLGKSGHKTNPTFLGLIAGIGLLAAAVIGLGAGCADPNLANDMPTVVNVSPGQIREKIAAKQAADAEKEALAESETLGKDPVQVKVSTFAEFTLSHPRGWQVEYWPGGMTMRDPKTGHFVSVFEQLVGHPAKGDAATKTTISGYEAIRYSDTSPKDGAPYHIVEIDLHDMYVEINATAPQLDAILQTLTFTGTPEKPINQWDIREKRTCLQIATYAKPRTGGTCELYPTPCDVPTGYEVCTSE